MNSQKFVTQSSLFEANSAWKEPRSHQAFANSRMEMASDLEKALDEDRNQIQKEIASQRRKHAVKRKKEKSLQLKECDNETAGIKSEERDLSSTPARSDRKKEGSIGAGSNETLPDSLPATSGNQSIISVLSPAQVIADQQDSCVSDQFLLDQIASLYSEIIKGLYNFRLVSLMY